MIREWKPSDDSTLQEIYARRGMAEWFPNLADPLFMTKLVLADDHDVPRLAAAVRLEGNVYTFVDPTYGDPIDRWLCFQQMHDKAILAASEKGLDSVTCQVPPKMERFGKRLMSLGWDKALWPTYGRRI